MQIKHDSMKDTQKNQRTIEAGVVLSFRRNRAEFIWRKSSQKRREAITEPELLTCCVTCLAFAVGRCNAILVIASLVWFLLKVDVTLSDHCVPCLAFTGRR